MNLIKCLEKDPVTCDMCGSSDWTNIKHRINGPCFINDPVDVFQKITDVLINGQDYEQALKIIEDRLALIKRRD